MSRIYNNWNKIKLTQQTKIDYRIEKLSKLSGLKLKDSWLYSGIKAKSHRLDLENSSIDYISLRYNAKQFLYVLDSMINLLELMQKNGFTKDTIGSNTN